MDLVKGILGIAATVGIAASVAYAVSAPRNVDNMMNQEMASLDGKSINQTMAEAKAKADAQQCEQARRMAEDAWDRAVDRGDFDDQNGNLAYLEDRVKQFCK